MTWQNGSHFLTCTNTMVNMPYWFHCTWDVYIDHPQLHSQMAILPGCTRTIDLLPRTGSNPIKTKALKPYQKIFRVPWSDPNLDIKYMAPVWNCITAIRMQPNLTFYIDSILPTSAGTVGQRQNKWTIFFFPLCFLLLCGDHTTILARVGWRDLLKQENTVARNTAIF